MAVYYNNIHELDYCLMCSVELGQIGADTARYIGNYMPNVSEWYDWREERNRNLEIHSDSNWYETFCKDFERDVENKYTRWVRTEAEPQEHANCVYGYLSHASFMFSELVGTYSGELIADVTGNKEVSSDFVLEKARSVLPTHIESNRHIQTLLKRHEKFVRRNKKVDVGLLRQSAWAVKREYLDQQRWKRSLYDELLQGKSAKSYKEETRLMKAYRKIAKKSVSVLSSMAGQETTSAFVNGKDIDIIGDLFTYKITRNCLLANAQSNSYGALNIEVFDTDSNTFLFNLCWYLDETPAAEQLMGFILHVRAGNEEEILRTGNNFSFNSDLPADVATNVNKILKKVYLKTKKLSPFLPRSKANSSDVVMDMGMLFPLCRKLITTTISENKSKCQL